MITHGSLFSGIGGFDLAATWVGWKNLFHCEYDEKAQLVLKKRFPNTLTYGDIKHTDFTIHRGTIDVLSGGFPCQPYSTAGKRKGKEDDRHLWPEMLRAVREIQPRYVVGENVRGLTNWSGGLVFDEVQADLEAEGYEVLPFLLPACAVNAPHRRDRIWFVAYNANARTESVRREWKDEVHGFEFTPNSNSESRQQDVTGWEINRQEWESVRNNAISINEGGGAADTNKIGSSNQEQIGKLERKRHRVHDVGDIWKEFPTQSPVCGRNDGISNRVDRLKQLGNAIVPQVAYELFKVIDSHLSS